MAIALISLGSNLGDRQATLDAAVARLRETAGVAHVFVSSYHATQPVGGPEEQEGFLNAAARLETSLSPRELLIRLQSIERELGRVRHEHWGPRTIDLDLLLYDDQVIDEPDLIVPHRFLPFRRFVLEPGVEVAGEMVHPLLSWTMTQLLGHAQCAANRFSVVADSPKLAEAFMQRLQSAGIVAAAAKPKAVFRLGTNTPASNTVPTLILPADDLDRAVREAVAAIQAMQ